MEKYCIAKIVTVKLPQNWLSSPRLTPPTNAEITPEVLWAVLTTALEEECTDLSGTAMITECQC